VADRAAERHTPVASAVTALVPVVGLIGTVAGLTLAAWVWFLWGPHSAVPAVALAAGRSGSHAPLCWNPWCTLRGCDGVHHVGPPGNRTWTQPQGWEWDRATGTYRPPPPTKESNPWSRGG